MQLWNINHFIVSQVNPHVIPFLRPLSSSPSAYSPSLLFSLLPRTIDFLSSSIKSTLLNLLSAVPLPFQSPIRFMLDQSYVGDITVTPPISARDYSLLLKNPSADRLHACLRASEQATWKLMSMIRGACEIEMALDDGVRRMRGQLILQEVAEARKVERLSRVRSWSTDFEGKKRGDDDEEDEEQTERDRRDVRDEEGDTSELSHSDSIQEEREDAEDDDGDHQTPSSSSKHRRDRRPRCGGKRPIRPVRHEAAPPSPDVPLRRRSVPVASLHGVSGEGPPALVSTSSEQHPRIHQHGHTQSHPGSQHPSRLHLPSTTAEHAPYISALDGKNAASVMAHRSTGESVAHAYVLAAKSLKREALKRGATDGPQPKSVPPPPKSGARTAATTPRRDSQSRDELTSPGRARTPPAPSSDAALSYEELILSRQTSTRLQQLVRAQNRVQSPNHTGRSEDSAAVLSPPAMATTLPLPPGAQPSPPPDDPRAMTVPGLVQFRPVERRHLSTLDLQRLADKPGDEATDSDVEDEKGQLCITPCPPLTLPATRAVLVLLSLTAHPCLSCAAWNAMMVRSDTDSESDSPTPPSRPNSSHPEDETKEGASSAASSRPPSATPSTSSRFAYLTSLFPFQSMYRSKSSVDPPTYSDAVGENKQQPRAGGAATGRHSASHDRLDKVSTAVRPGGGSGGSGRGSRAGARPRVLMPRNLSLNELAGDLSSVPLTELHTYTRVASSDRIVHFQYTRRIFSHRSQAPQRIARRCKSPTTLSAFIAWPPRCTPPHRTKSVRWKRNSVAA